MRICLYNWVQYDDPERRGGGVRIYQHNLIQHLAEHTDHTITVISSGLEHDVLNPQVRIESTTNALSGRVRSYTVVNSPVLAPGHHAFGNPRLFDEGEMLQTWHEFLRDQGPFDVVQFDSLEGIPFTFLRVHEVLPEARVLLYAHNYYAVCPQVNLWKWESQACTDYRNGHDCVNCVPHLANPTEVLRAHQASRLLRQANIRPGSAAYSWAYRIYGAVRRRQRNPLVRALALPVRRVLLGRGQTPAVDEPPVRPASKRTPADANPTQAATPVTLRSTSQAPKFVARRTRALELIGGEVDRVMCTSNRVLEVLRAHGVPEEKLTVSYVGTRAAEASTASERRKETHVEGQLTICYLGYMRPDKGFFFLLKTLEATPSDVLSRLRLVLGARMADERTMQRLYELSSQMLDIVYYDGYTHTQLPEILDGVDVGVVPVQWEDNLPQVATEMVAHGIPVITSHRGGAQELGGSNEDFVFTATESSELIDIWRRLLEWDLRPGDYWESAPELTTMHDHVDRLMDIYAGTRTGTPTL